MPDKNQEEFVKQLSLSIDSGTFVRATLGNYKGEVPQLQKVTLRLIDTKRGRFLQLVYRYSDREQAANFEPGLAADKVSDLLGSGFRSGHLFTMEADFQLAKSKKGKSLVSKSLPTHTSAPDTRHDRQKEVPVSASEPFLRELGITTADGLVKTGGRSKWKQINHFVSIVDGLLTEAGLDREGDLSVVDMGCGKGYLTFGLFSHLRSKRKGRVAVIGVEVREDLVRKCSEAAGKCGFEGLEFREGKIETTETGDHDVLIALHACDTATDDAIFRGIRAGAPLIVTAPCCHKEIRRQISPSGAEGELFRHGLFLEKEAELITDAIRAYLLESRGYEVKVIDFIAGEHTAKNTMIAAVLREDAARFDPSPVLNELKLRYGIRRQHLEFLLFGQND